jgi:hypothetical protein
MINLAELSEAGSSVGGSRKSLPTKTARYCRTSLPKQLGLDV